MNRRLHIHRRPEVENAPAVQVNRPEPRPIVIRELTQRSGFVMTEISCERFQCQR